MELLPRALRVPWMNRAQDLFLGFGGAKAPIHRRSRAPSARLTNAMRSTGSPTTRPRVTSATLLLEGSLERVDTLGERGHVGLRCRLERRQIANAGARDLGDAVLGGRRALLCLV